MTQINKVLIVGGGTSGWLTAAILARKLFGQVQICLVESPDIPTIGVGEGTFPTMVETLKYIGIPEHKFMSACSATFKQAIKFVDWEYPPDSNRSRYYYHLFDAPFNVQNLDLSEAWLRGLRGESDYAHALAGQAAICDAGLAPKKISTPDFVGLTKYAYHLDAGKFGGLLAEHCVHHLGVTHIKANVESVRLDNAGYIAAVSTKEMGEISADLFVDCTGFSALLLGEALQVPFIDKSKVLFVDHAVTMQVPYPTLDHPIACHTISTAHNAGWTWDIGLRERRGIGYVYSSSHTDHEAAERVLRAYVGPEAEQLVARRLKMQIGYREKTWEKNCVGIGISAGFMEPLEATAIAMVELSALMLAGQFPRTRSGLPGLSAKFNQTFRFRWDKIVDFIKLHYCLSKRRDSDFWLDNVQESSIPGSLLDKLQLWQEFMPTENDFPNRFELFSLASYQYILYGLNFKTKPPAVSKFEDDRAVNFARGAFEQLDEKIKSALGELPAHRQLIEALYSAS